MSGEDESIAAILQRHSELLTALKESLEALEKRVMKLERN